MKNLPWAVNPVGENFDLSPATAEQLWSSSVPLPINDSEACRERLRLSSCGQWAVRKWNLEENYSRLSAEDIGQVATREFQRLEAHGIPVISRAAVASSADQAIFIVSPWIPQFNLAETTEYANVVPKLKSYYKDAEEDDWVLHDIDLPEQYSHTPGLNEVMLHDADPQLGQLGALQAYGVLRI